MSNHNLTEKELQSLGSIMIKLLKGCPEVPIETKKEPPITYVFIVRSSDRYIDSVWLSSAQAYKRAKELSGHTVYTALPDDIE